MFEASFALPEYLARIGFVGETRTDPATLRALMRRQLRTIPFENLDVRAGRGVSLEPTAIVNKLMVRKRGGYCYELNGLFSMALHALGFDYSFVAARPMFLAAKRPKTHMALIVRVAGEAYLCDLGFGNYGLREPLALPMTHVTITQDQERFRLTRSGESYLLEAEVSGTFQPQYAFDLCPQEWIDFAPANYWNSTHPESLFVRRLLVLMHHDAGRTLLFDDELTVIRDTQVSKCVIAPHDRELVLREHFGLIAP